MSNISDRTTIYHRDGTSETLPAGQARYKVYTNPGEWSLTPPPPPGWEREIPKYKIVRDLKPASRARYRSEPPFESLSDNSCWQFGDRELVAGEIITTTRWPHESMKPLTFGAEQVLQFFKNSMRSRLPLSPWHEGRIRLDNGLSDAPGIVVSTPQVPRFNSRPAA